MEKEKADKAPLIVNAELEKVAIEAAKNTDPTEASTSLARGAAKLIRQAIEGGNDTALVTKMGDLADALDRAHFGPRTAGPMTPEREARAEENRRIHEDAVDADAAARRRANTPVHGDTMAQAAERERAAEKARAAEERADDRAEAARKAHR